MPAKSAAQLRAMFAAKSGHSTLGIPKSVGAKFVAETPNKGELMKHGPEVRASRRANVKQRFARVP